jgi:hypothetical protein
MSMIHVIQVVAVFFEDDVATLASAPNLTDARYSASTNTDAAVVLG